MNYQGWSLFDKILLVCRHEKDGIRQAYLCDPTNKKQIENAKSWGESWCREGWNPETRTYAIDKKIPAEEFEFNNEDFTFELFDSAGGSSQGGKLSFWNCIVSKDNKKFKIGISADLLLDLLLSSTFVNGVCSTKVLFARKNGSVGVLHQEMSQYQDAINDMKKKEDVKKKTSRHLLYHNYITVNYDDMYIGDFYQWYEPLYEARSNNYLYYSRYSNYFIGIKKLNKPIIKKLFLPTRAEYKTVKEYLTEYDKERYLYYYLFDKLPARAEGNVIIENNVTREDWNMFFNRKRENTNIKDRYSYDILEYYLSADPDKAPTLSDEFRKLFKEAELKIIEVGE